MLVILVVVVVVVIINITGSPQATIFKAFNLFACGFPLAIPHRHPTLAGNINNFSYLIFWLSVAVRMLVPPNQR